MRNFFISYRLSTSIGYIEGDCVADMADDGVLDAQYLNQVKTNVRQRIIDKMTQDGVALKSVGDMVIIACIPLERNSPA